MTLKTNANGQSNFAVSNGDQPLADRSRTPVPRLRRSAHRSVDFVAGAILVPLDSDVNWNLETSAQDFTGVTPNINGAPVAFASGAAPLEMSGRLSGTQIAALDEEEEDEDDDEYDDDDIDDEDDEDLEDDEDAEFDDEDDLDDDDDDLDVDDLEDEDDEEDDEDDEDDEE